MKISNNKIGGAGPKIDSAKTAKSEGAQALNKDVKSSGGPGAKSAADLRSSSAVDISDRAQMMNQIKGLASDQGIDEAKVARLQKLIDDGKYKTDASKIADRLVDEHLAMDDV